METQTKNNGRRGDKRKYRIIAPDGFIFHNIVGMTRRKELEQEGFEFEEVK